ncbi:MAG TPA: methyltransferase domain-containing protein [Actinomycetota bacterium]|nr:methyltransferase domain-containing protein [Actinomycetota bacterium]
MGVHDAAATGFESASGEYERARPGYPADAVDALIRRCEIGPGSRVLDLACGTGKLTRALSPSGARVVGADPVDGMLRRLVESSGGVPVAEATAEHLPFASSVFDAVTVAQAFHWFDGDAALGEIHRVLRPAGGLALLWNIRDTTVPWVGRLNDVFNRYEGDVMRFWRGEWRHAFERSALFTPLERHEFRLDQTLTREGVIDRVLSVSFIATLPAGERARVIDDVGRILDENPETRGSDRIVLPYLTHLYTCRRTP